MLLVNIKVDLCGICIHIVKKHAVKFFTRFTKVTANAYPYSFNSHVYSGLHDISKIILKIAPVFTMLSKMQSLNIPYSVYWMCVYACLMDMRLCVFVFTGYVFVCV